MIPKRNIETWIHYLQGESIDEETAYSKFPEELACKAYVENWVNQDYWNLDDKTPLSLQAACEELQRVMQLLK